MSRDVFLIQRPLLTEKAGELSAAGKYVFIVKPGATKNEIRKALQEIYGVEAIKVNVINLPRKPRRFRGIKGYLPGCRKAVVTLKQGQKIEVK